MSGAYLLIAFSSPASRDVFWEEPKEVKLKVSAQPELQANELSDGARPG